MEEDLEASSKWKKESKSETRNETFISWTERDASLLRRAYSAMH